MWALWFKTKRKNSFYENKLKDLAKEYTEFAINEIKEINGGEDAKKYFIEFFYYEWYWFLQ